MIDLTGLRFGHLTVIERGVLLPRGVLTWMVICDCGNHSMVRSELLRKGATTTCGCRMGCRTRLIDLTGRKFHMLKVVKRAGELRSKSGGTVPLWEVICDCGTTKTMRGAVLRNGQVRSCGCMGHHGMYGTPEYGAWRSMIDRCTNPRTEHYRLYGGRGITVCQSWMESFPAFLKDVGLRPSQTHSLDRYPNNATGNYEPGNVRWATRKDQARNKRNCHVLTVEGESLTLAEWTERLGCSQSTIRERLRRGWTPSDAVNTPVP